MSLLTVETYREAEVKCLHCGHTVGFITQRQGVAGAPTMFRDGRGNPPLEIKSLRVVRCGQCTGPVYTDDFDVRYVYPKLDEVDRPRRGRPPKWLVEARRAREAELAS